MTKAKGSISSIETVRTFFRVGTCSEALCNVLNLAFDHPLKFEEHAALPLAGGIMQHGFQCGLIWGSTLAAGAQAYRLHGPGPKAETAAVLAAQRLVESFRARNNNINCLELTDTDWHKSMQVVKYFLTRGGPIRCFRLAAQFAPIAFNETHAALSEPHADGTSPPVSCAALLAKKMGASDMQAVMAAGFAGGIGFCGGACGALGAAIWIIGMERSRENAGKIEFHEPRATEAIDKFLGSTDFKFECSEIVGRRFENIEDHAGYVRDGGCSEIIEVLAST